MQRKKTAPQEVPDELPELTDQQYEFVRGILAGKTASDAYRAAYDASKMLPNSIWCEASKLRHDPNVAQWLAAARKAHLGHAKITLDQHVQRLDELKQIAIETGNVGAAVQAEQLIGKATGHYVERLDLNVNNPDDLLSQIREIAPELAERIEATEH